MVSSLGILGGGGGSKKGKVDLKEPLTHPYAHISHRQISLGEKNRQ